MSMAGGAAEKAGVPVPAGLGGTFYVGSTPSGEWQLDAVIDELRISDTPRLGNSDSCGGFLVADSGNHRIQAFDWLGRFLAAFGSFGSGPGEFNNPQGLAVHSSGRSHRRGQRQQPAATAQFRRRQLRLPTHYRRGLERTYRRGDLRRGPPYRRGYRQQFGQGAHPRRQRLCGDRVCPAERRLRRDIRRAAGSRWRRTATSSSRILGTVASSPCAAHSVHREALAAPRDSALGGLGQPWAPGRGTPARLAVQPDQL